MSEPIIQKTTAVRLEAPFTDKGLAEFLDALGDNFPNGVTVVAQVAYDARDSNGTVMLVATETKESNYEPKPEAG